MLFVALVLVYGVVSYPRSAATSIKLYSIGLDGVTGAANNTALVFGRYVLVAPFAPTTGVTDDGYLDIDNLNNSLLYLVDAKKPGAPLITKDMKGWDATPGSKTVFFPTRVAYDEKSSNVYVRGTRFDRKDGEVTPIDVIAYVNLHQDADGMPQFDNNVVSIDIPQTSKKQADGAPMYFAVSGQGDLLVFTNGASVYSYDLLEGYVQELGIVDAANYSADDTISYLDVDPTTNIVTVCRNRRTEDEAGQSTTTSELSFYRLGKYGAFQFLGRVNPGGLPDGAALAAGSNVIIVSDPDSNNADFALFVTNDGSLCQVDINGDEVAAEVKHLKTFPELSASARDSSPSFILYDSTKRTVGIVKPGFTVQITRPINGRRGRITRPINVRLASGTPVLAMAKLTKRNKVGSVNALSSNFAGEGGLSNLVIGENSDWLISTYSGQLYSVDVADDVQNSKLQFVGMIGSKVDRIDYYADRSSIVAINSFTPGDDGVGIAEGGSLVVAKITESTPLLQALLPTASMLGRHAPAIRRPCNIRR